MARTLCIFLLSASLLSGCDSTVGFFVDAQWKIYCPAGSVGCGRDGQANDIFATPGEDGFDGSCRVVEVDGVKTITTRISQAAGGERATRVQLDVDALQLNATNQVVGGGCAVTIEDDDIVYGGARRGTCGAGTPTDDIQPCQISNVQIDLEAEEGTSLRYDLVCRNIKADVDPMRFTRDLAQHRNQSAPAAFRFLNCTGLE